MTKLLEVKNLQVSFHTYAGEVQSVRGVEFHVNAGESLAIVGESGCGKSVTAKTIMGLINSPGEIKKNSEILYEGKNILNYTDKEWQSYRGSDCSIIFQDALASLNPTMNIGNQIIEKIMAHKKISKEEARQEAIELLKLVGISNGDKRMKQYPHEFSGGMRQRVMIAIALACNPKILIADEPTTALDVTIQADIIELIKDLQAKFNMSLILITHDLGIVANVANKIVVMYAGKVVESGTNVDVFYNPKHPYTKALLESVPRLDLDAKKELCAIEGNIPSMISPPKGCAFSSRCNNCMFICEKQSPPKFEFDKNHYVECWMYHPILQEVNTED